MTKDRIIELYLLHREKIASSAEQQEFEELLSLPEAEHTLKEFFGHTWDNLSPADFTTVTVENSKAILTNIVTMPQTKQKKAKLWPRIAVAASIVFAVLIGGYFYSKKQGLRSKDQGALSIANDIAPGKNGATLTLANGQKILINDALAGDIANESGVRISKLANGQISYTVIASDSEGTQYNTLSTSRGEQVQIRLPDGTSVWLNAESSLTYPTSFAKLDKRLVTLTGEGYFEVAKDKAHPFRVDAAGQQVEVLGTHFNINSYADESAIRTTLLEGSVKVGQNGTGKVLKPGEQAVLKGAELTVLPVDVENAVAWKNGMFVFEDEPLYSVMRRVARWYDVEVVYDADVDQNKLYWGGVSRFDNVSQVLRKLELTEGIHFKIEGRRILVMR